MSGIVDVDATELARLIRGREVSCAEVMTAYLDRIEAYNPAVNAIVALRERSVLLAQARERDDELRDGRYRGWMHGFPLAVKDLAAAAGFPLTHGSPVFADQVAEADDLFVRRMRDAGAIVIGKTNVPEFGFGSHTYNPVYGVTRNPYDLSRTAGGSSGGAAAAVALRLLPVADGSDYLGSLRNPAAFCNVLGLRPSAGRVPSPGWLPQLSTAGPMGRTVADVAAFLGVLAGPALEDPLSLESAPAETGERDVRGTRVAWVGDWRGYLATEPGVLDVCRRACDVLAGLGCVVEDALPDFAPERVWRSVLAWRAWNAVSKLGSLTAAQVDQLKPELRWELDRGRELTVDELTLAVAERDAWYAAVLELFERYDFVLAPSAQVFPFDVELTWPREVGGRAMDTYHRWMETVAPWSLAGVPALGMPAGFDARGLPMGVQLIGPPRADQAVLRLAHAYEQVTHYPTAHPPEPSLAG
ncbi:amidase [Amycolatopsis suaedae]|uniref:amidase n=1 Tax=Amycolatopsis suaedae TaxID=2510978 RepID=UPI001F10CAEC|nr:amidase [Amycolatopsis suaedae]